MNGIVVDIFVVLFLFLCNFCDGYGWFDFWVVGWFVWLWVFCYIFGYFGWCKCWNYWCIVSFGWMFLLIIVDFDYLIYGVVYFFDLDSGQVVVYMQICFFGFGCQLFDELQVSYVFEYFCL